MYLKRAIPIILIAFFFFLIAIPSVQAVPQSYGNLRITIKPQRPASYQGTDAEFQANPTYVQGEQANFNITFTSEVRWGWSRLRLPVYIPPERIRTTFPNPGSRVTLDHLSWGYYAYTSPVLTEVGNNNHTLNIVVYTIKRFRFFGRTYRMPVPAAVAQKSISVAVRSVDVEITSPVEGAVLNTNPLHVEGTVDDNSASITVNGLGAVVSDNQFSVDVNLEEGLNLITAIAENEYGNTDSDSINVTLDTIPPQNPAISIDGGEYTNNQAITLTLSAVGAVEMAISEDPAFLGTVWEPYVETRTFTLFGGDASKTIYVKYRDEAQNETLPVSDSIILDTTLPQIEILSPVDESITNQGQTDVSGIFTEVNPDTITVNGTRAVIEGNTFTASGVQLNNEGDNPIRAVITDLAGQANSDEINIIRDTTPPQNPSMTINEGGYTNSTAVNLTLSADEAVSMIISENPDFSGAEWEAYITAKGFTLTPGDGPKTIYVKFRDEIQNETQSVSDTTTLDQTPPQLTITIPLDGALTNQVEIAVTGTYIEANLDTITVNDIPAIAADGIFTIENLVLSEGDNTITVLATDLASNTNSEMVHITLDSISPQNTSVTIDQGEYTTTRNITLTLHAEDETPIQMMISENQDFSDATWETYSTTRVWTLSNLDGLRTIYARFMDAAGNESGIVSDTVVLDSTVPELSITNPSNDSYTNVTQIDVTGTFTEINLDAITVNTIQADIQGDTFTAQNIQLIEGTNTITVVITDLAGNSAQGVVTITLDTIPPQNPGININEGAYTNSATINLTLSAEGADEMAISEDPAFPDSQWEAYTDTRVYTLSAGDGSKAVYIKYRDLAGNETQPVNDSIILDTTPPQITITLPENEAIINRNPVEIVGIYTEENLNEIRVNGARATVIDFGPDYAFRLTLTLNEGNNSITAIATDLAGNSAQDIINVELDTIPPENPGIIINEGVYTNNSRINLTLSAEEAVGMLISENQNFTNAVWETYSPDKTWTLSSGDGDRTIYIKYRDRAQNETLPISDSIVLDTTPPQIQIEYPEDNLTTEETEIDVSGIFTESNIGTITVNGIPAVIEGNAFSVTNVPLANEGDNPIRTLATDLAQNQGFHEINIIRDTAISMNPSIIIDEGDNANNGIIHLTLYADGATEVALSENQYLNRAVWEPYSESKVWVLSSGNGPKTVYARFKDTYGNLSEIVQDSVTLNQEGPYITIEDGEYSNRSVVRVILHAEGVTEVMLSENPDFSGASWEPYEETKLFTLSSEGGRKVIYAQFR